MRVLGIVFCLLASAIQAMDRKQEEGQNGSEKFNVNEKLTKKSNPNLYTHCRALILNDALHSLMSARANPAYEPNDDDVPMIEYTIHQGSRVRLFRPLENPDIVVVQEALGIADTSLVNPLSLRGQLLQRRMSEAKIESASVMRDNPAHQVKIGYEYKGGEFFKASFMASFEKQEVAFAKQKMIEGMHVMQSYPNLKFIDSLLEADLEGSGEEADEEGDGVAE